MKRTNLVLDEQQLEKAVLLGGHRTYSDAVNHALAEYVRLMTLSGIYRYAGSNIWEGDLSRMREDSDVSR
jgi:hypothetical protein